ncbi:prp1 [Candida jiufengensis]|uniref:prp1 n=1 Tax=Candida jiufengensis TaxID=497108 RepID=UPI002224F2D4|nr:prp1 [Candida jiufengensis]KAI5954466.1 prp1 [Candida jiufengensis]
MSNNRLAFLDQEPPPGYIAGVGRGAVGFSTGADFKNELPQVYDDDEDENSANQELNENGLLTTRSKRDEEDEEADRIYEEIEQKLKRRKTNSQPKQITKSGSPENDNKELTEKTQFSDLKRDLKSLTEDDWLSLPEAGDMTRKNKRQRILDQQSQRLYAVPDQILAGNNGSFGFTRTLNTSNNKNNALSAQLDSFLPSSLRKQNTTTTRELEEEILNFDGADKDAKYIDLKKSRLIFASLRKTEPYKSSSWISSARLEEDAKNFNKAREYIQQGCKMIPGDEDVWLEYIRLNKNDPEFAKAITKEALNYCNKSTKLWLRSVELELDNKLKKKQSMKALQQLPRNIVLWRKILELEDDKEMIVKLLLKAVDLCPNEWELWLKLIDLSDYNDAKAYLNKARKILQGDLKVWIAACKLEEREASSDSSKINELAERAVKENASVEAEKWYEVAIELDKEGYNKTSRALLECYLKSQQYDSITLLEEAEKYKGNLNISHYIMDYLISIDPHNQEVWDRLFITLKKSKNYDSLIDYYEKAVDLNPGLISLHLSFANDKWRLGKDVEGARFILESTDNELNDDSIKFAIININMKTGNLSKAKDYITTIIQTEPKRHAKYWSMYIHILRCLNIDSKEILKASDKALEFFPNNLKLCLQKVSILIDDINDLRSAREFASEISDKNKKFIEVWIKYSEIEEKLGVLIKARSILDKALLINPESPELAIAQIELEKRAKNTTAVKNLTNKYIKKFSSNAYIWYLYLSLIPKMSHKKPEFINALRSTNNSSEMLMYLGIFFWQDGKFSKSKTWFDRSMEEDTTNGDAWGWMNNFYKSHGTDDEKEKFYNEYEEKYLKFSI